MENTINYEAGTKAETIPHHIQLAREAANAMINQLNLDQQNEALREIRDVLLMQRKERIEHLERDLKYTIDCCEGILK